MTILKSIGDFIFSIGALILNLLSGLMQMIIMIPSALTMLTSSVAYMPTILVAFAMALITVSIVYLVVGR